MCLGNFILILAFGELALFGALFEDGGRINTFFSGALSTSSGNLDIDPSWSGLGWFP
jgi:hypothetical protein